MNQNQIVFNQGIFETVEQLEKKCSLKVGSYYDFATKSLNKLFEQVIQTFWASTSLATELKTVCRMTRKYVGDQLGVCFSNPSED